MKYLKRRLNQEEACEDLCQDVLLRIHAFRHTYLKDKPFEPWMYTIARHTMIDYMRSKKRKDKIMELSDEEVGNAFEMQEADAKIAMRAAIDELSPEQKQALDLTKLQGLSVEEAAKVSGISEANLKVRTHRALNSIKKALNPDSDSAKKRPPKAS